MMAAMSRKLIAALLAGISVAGGTTASVIVEWEHRPADAVAVHRAVATETPLPSPSASDSSPPLATPLWTPGQALPRTLQASLDLRSPYAGVPLRFQAPTLGIDVPVLGVGLTSGNAIDAPKGAADAPVWDEGFWYRGSAEPGQPGVFALAGHVDRVGGAAAAFANLHRIQAGDVVDVIDQRTGVAWRYRITDTQSFDMNNLGKSDVLDRIYGADVAQGLPPSVPTDMVARISILTCAGTWTGTQYDHRFVAFGDLVGPAA
jgi:hypothetical protein